MNRSLMAVAVLAVSACGGGGSGTDGGVVVDGGGASADAGFATLTLTGAATGTASAGIISTYTPSTNLGQLDIRGNVGGLATQVAFYFPGAPSAQTYVASSDGGIDCSLQIYVTDGGLDGWAANFGSGLPDVGACTLTLTGATISADHTTQRDYAVHGTLTATASGHAGSATGTVNYSASF